MGGAIGGERLGALVQADVLIATRLRDALHPAEKDRGAIDKGGGAIERIRRDTVYSDGRMGHLAPFEPAQGQVLFGRIERIGRWFRGGVIALFPRRGARGLRGVLVVA